MAGRKSDFTLPTNTLDELFSSQEERDEAKLSKIRDIPLEEIDDFPDHPFKVREDEDTVGIIRSEPERTANILKGIFTAAWIGTRLTKKSQPYGFGRRKSLTESTTSISAMLKFNIPF